MSFDVPFAAHTAAIKVNRLLREHPTLGPELLEKNRNGFFFLLVDQCGDEVFAAVIGEHPEEKLLTFQRFAREKIARTRLHFVTQGHVLSRESANERLEMFPGAVVSSSFGASTSGYPSHADELCSLAVLVQIGEIERDDALRLLRRLPNKYFNENRQEDRTLFETL